MKISLVIPYLEVDSHKAMVLQRCIDSFKGQYDELIIEDSPTDSLAKKINDGMRKATGDYLVLSNDDVTAREGTLKDLCNKGEVNVPVVHGGIDKVYHGHMAAMSREVWEDIGEYDESCPGPYFIDSDYWVRIVESDYRLVKHAGVHIDHPEPGRTLKKVNANMDSCRQWFMDKWNVEYYNMIL